jgi:predicted Zn-dependent protease
LALALSGQTDQAKPLVDELTKGYPQDTIINSTWLPVIRAAMDLQRGNAAGAIEQLQPTSRYEAAAEFWLQYLRGQAYLRLKQGSEAATEFQRILDHRGYAPLSVLYPLAHLGVARAAALSGGSTQSLQEIRPWVVLHAKRRPASWRCQLGDASGSEVAYEDLS